MCASGASLVPAKLIFNGRIHFISLLVIIFNFYFSRTLFHFGAKVMKDLHKIDTYF
jgi:hypothetical protein